MLREGLEAALIVSLIASYLKRTQRGRWIGVMWIGVLLAAALCLALGIFINETTGEFPQKEQELFEGIVAVIAVVILTWIPAGCRHLAAVRRDAGTGYRGGSGLPDLPRRYSPQPRGIL